MPMAYRFRILQTIDYQGFVTQHEERKPNKPPSLRTCSRSFKNQNKKGQVDELQAGVEFALAVFPQPSAFLQPGERAPYNPALGNDGKGV